MKGAREIFGKVDPGLKIISRRGRATQKDWKASGGATCPKCELETVRLPGGVCPLCADTANLKEQKKEEKHAKVLVQVNKWNARIKKRALKEPFLR